MSTKTIKALFRTSIITCLTLCAASQVRVVTGQAPPPDPAKQAEKNQDSKTERDFGALVRSAGAFDAASKKLVDDWVMLYMKYMHRNQEPTNASAARVRLVTQLAAKTKPEIRTAIADKIFELAGRLVDNPATPVPARVNAMWLIADLDQTPATNTPPVPYANATGKLFNIAKNDKYPSYVRSIALSGLDRHARIIGSTWPENTKATLGKDLAAVVSTSPATNLDVQGHVWMVRKTYDVLTTLRSLAAGKTAIEQLADMKALPSIRLASAKYLSNFDLTNPALKDYKVTIFLATLQLANQECAGWIKQYQNQMKLQSGGGMDGGYGGGMMGGSDAMGGMGLDGGSGYGGEGMMGGGMPGDGGMGGGYGGYGGSEGGMMGPGMGKPVDLQTWDCKIARRKINVYSQVCHQLIFGVPYFEPKDPKKSPSAPPPLKPTNVKSGGVANGTFVTEFSEQGVHFDRLKDAFEKFQSALNERTITDIASLQSRLGAPSQTLKLEIEKIPGYEKYLPPKKLWPGSELAAMASAPNPAGALPADGKAPASEPRNPPAAGSGAAPAGAPPAGAAPGGQSPVGRAPSGQGANGQVANTAPTATASGSPTTPAGTNSSTVGNVQGSSGAVAQ